MLANDDAVLAKFVLLVFGLGLAGMLLQTVMKDHTQNNVISAKFMDPSDSSRSAKEAHREKMTP